MKLYHGTTGRHFHMIRTNGIKPRGRNRSLWKDAPSHARAVYLTTGYAMHFAEAASKKGEQLMIVEVDSDKLKQNLLAPDEDFLEQGSRGQPPHVEMKERTAYFRKHAFKNYRHLWKDSVTHLGTVAYYGTVEPQAITRIALLDREKSGSIRVMSDPTITLLNHRFMGEQYRQLMSHIFGDPVIETDMDKARKMAAESIGHPYTPLSDIPREGISVF